VAADRALTTYWYDRVPNLGDALAPVILAHVSGAVPVHVPPDTPGKVLGVGSNLSKLAEADTVWGAGALWDEPIDPPAGVRILAVRGPRTRAVLRTDVPPVYGDPVLLLPRWHTPAAATRHEVGVVPHYADREAMRTHDPAIAWIDVTGPWREVVDRIAGCAVIVSSSLHGLIVAEAYGIPAVWVRAGDRVLGGAFKFDDHYLGTGRDARPPVAFQDGIATALRHLAPAPVWDPQPLLEAARDLPGCTP
jgi:pyruvyltransferase